MARRRGRLATLAVGAALTALVLVVSLTGAVRQLELDTVDARFAIRGSTGPPSGVLLVAIDDRTFAQLGRQWPFPRGLHARVIDRLRRAGAKVIVYDVQFTEPDAHHQDQALADAVGRARGHVVLATSQPNDRGESDILGGEATVRALGARSANNLLPNDVDGVARRIDYAVSGMKSIAVVAAGIVHGRPVPRQDFASGSVWIDYHGNPGTVPGVSFADVLRGRVQRSRLRGKVVVVGVTSPSAQDVHTTSVSADELMSGAEVHANAISTVLRGEPLHAASRGVEALLVVLLGLLVPLASLRRSRRAGRRLLALAGLAVAVGVVYAVTAQLAFDGGLILPLVCPLAALVAGSVGVLGVEATAAAYEREQEHDLLLRYVPEEVVDEIEASPDRLCLEPTRRQATIIFCDLRGFTPFTEFRDEQQVWIGLNLYLREMSEAVRDEGGTLLRFEGDGILAVFGAPIEQTDHADRALAAVRQMIGPRLERLNAWVHEQGLGDGFRVGIGVNSGPILSGNVGCEWRMEYTAIGDTVNTASRLEALTKDAPHAVLVSDTTRAMLQRHVPELRYVDAATIRGKRIKVNLWTLAPGAPEAPAPAGRPEEPVRA